MTISRSKPCQLCSTVFDWSDDECPDCGWDKEAWVEDGRYWLQGNGTE